MAYKLLLVANANIARFYKCQGTKIQENFYTLEAEKLLTLHLPQRHKENFYGKLSCPSHFLDPHQEAKEINRKEFSRLVAEQVRTFYQEHLFSSFVIMAEPKFLGELRKDLDKQILTLITREVSKDLAHQSYSDLEKYL
jgi:protein required for attachment to host cells